MNIIEPSHSQLLACFELEATLTYNSLDADTSGFFLPGTSFSVYEDLAKTGFVRCLFEDDNLVSFVVAIPPGHSIVRSMLTNSQRMILWGGAQQLDPLKSIWIAKVATSKLFRKKGYARRLYESAFAEFRGGFVYTATALSPKRNAASEAFHESLGLQRNGVFLSPKRDHVENIVNLLWHKVI